jgi:uncharacterized protein YbjT (DUF2867 family)
MSRVLVYQANGVQGGATLRRIQEAGFTARALIRNTSRAAEHSSLGVEVAVADLADRDALIRAHQSVDYVVLQIPAYADAFVATAIENAINALEATRVKGAIIKTANPSSLEATPDSGFSANAIVLNRMRSSAIPFSVVEPTMYLDTFLKPNFRREIARHNMIDLPIADDLKIAWTTVDDAARLAVCLLRSQIWGQTRRCAGETAYRGHELAAAFSIALGRQISYHSTALDEFQRDIESAIGAAAAAPVISKFRFLARLPEEASRMFDVATKVTSVHGTFAPTRAHDWISMNSASFSQGG